MPLYEFIALDDAGRSRRGQCEAANEAALGSLLRLRGQWLAEVRAVRSTPREPVRWGGGRRVSRRFLAQYFLTLGIQLRAGLNVLSALAFNLDATAPGGFRAIHAGIIERVRSGVPLSDSMASHPRVFSLLVVNLLRAGEASGRLGEVCEEIRQHYEWTERMAADLRQALVYPFILLMAIGGFFGVIFTFFLPRFTGVLKELGVDLPWITRALIATGDFMNAHFLTILLGAALTALAVLLGAKFSPEFARAIDRAKLRIPFFGPIVWQSCLSRLIQNLAILYRSGVPLLEGLALSQPLVGNRAVEESVRTLREGVLAGRSLHECMGQSTVFPPMLVQMAALGESTGTLDQALQNVADFYNLIVPRAVKQLFSVFQPVMIVGMLLIVGVIIMSVFLPLASALEAQ
jgi:type IV pilus assembly protein PilC